MPIIFLQEHMVFHCQAVGKKTDKKGLSLF